MDNTHVCCTAWIFDLYISLAVIITFFVALFDYRFIWIPIILFIVVLFLPVFEEERFRNLEGGLTNEGIHVDDDGYVHKFINSKNLLKVNNKIVLSKILDQIIISSYYKKQSLKFEEFPEIFGINGNEIIMEYIEDEIDNNDLESIHNVLRNLNEKIKEKNLYLIDVKIEDIKKRNGVPVIIDGELLTQREKNLSQFFNYKPQLYSNIFGTL